MKAVALLTAAVCAVSSPSHALSCDGPAGRNITVGYDGQKLIVTNLGKTPVHLTINAWGVTTEMSLGPGQSGSPVAPQNIGRYVTSFQTCTAT